MKHVCILCILILAVLPAACGRSSAEQPNVQAKTEDRSKSRVAHDGLTHPLIKAHEHSAPAQVLIKFKKGTGQPDIEQIQKQLGLETVRVVSRPNLYLMKTVKGQSVQEIVKRLQEFKAVDYAEPNYARTIQ